MIDVDQHRCKAMKDERGAKAARGERGEVVVWTGISNRRLSKHRADLIVFEGV